MYAKLGFRVAGATAGGALLATALGRDELKGSKLSLDVGSALAPAPARAEQSLSAFIDSNRYAGVLSPALGNCRFNELMPSPGNAEFKLAVVEREERRHGQGPERPPHRLDPDRERRHQGRRRLRDQVLYDQHDAFAMDIEQYDALIVRINPGQLSQIPGVEGVQAKFDALMNKFVASGRPVWSSPGVQTKMGAKDALCKIANMGCGLVDTLAYYDEATLDKEFRKTCAFQPRVIKQNRGSAGEGIWLCWLQGKPYCTNYGDASLGDNDKLKLIEMNDSHTEYHTVKEFLTFCVHGPDHPAAGTWTSTFPGQYLKGGVAAGGQLVDQRLLPRISEGEVRVLMSGDTCQMIIHKMPEGGGLSAVGGQAAYTFYKPEAAVCGGELTLADADADYFDGCELTDLMGKQAIKMLKATQKSDRAASRAAPGRAPGAPEPPGAREPLEALRRGRRLPPPGARRGARTKIAVVGSANFDTTYAVGAKLPTAGETVVTGGAPATCCGGKGLNQAVAAARVGGAGVAVEFAARVGDAPRPTPCGPLADGVARRVAATAAAGTGLGVVLLEDGGEVLSVVVRGANFAGWDGGEAWDDLDAGGEDRPLDPEHVANCDYLSPNLSELRRLVGADVSLDGDGALDAACRSLIPPGAATKVLLTLGARGSRLVSRDGPTLASPAVPGVAAVDATAAGDAFRAAFAVALAEGRGEGDALELAARRGGVSKAGAPSLPAAPATRC
ncbi:hypothetical protein JL722_10163 [Aureococcus anophagefferens]|nr:hypothetical protein JL722_10163 [Aureococcus anophagefferens]